MRRTMRAMGFAVVLTTLLPACGGAPKDPVEACLAQSRPLRDECLYDLAVARAATEPLLARQACREARDPMMADACLLELTRLLPAGRAGIAQNLCSDVTDARLRRYCEDKARRRALRGRLEEIP
ncbi:hypothetical protein K8I61_06085 [bacterium]|nr:hypothetical protein [bacterium]